MHPKHDDDIYGWAINTAQLLRDKKMSEVDFNSIIEELEALGVSHKRELIHRLGVLIAHLFKWALQPERKAISGKSWKGTIVRQRIDIEDLLSENKGLKTYIQELMPKAYKYALSILEEETPLDLKLLPKVCPYNFDQIMNEEFYPE